MAEIFYSVEGIDETLLHMGASRSVNDTVQTEAAHEPGKPTKAKLAQERSRKTRRKIVKAALGLWDSRGFEEGFDTTTVEDIAAAAEVSRATVYYYFPKKEDILRDLAWVAAEETYECALRSMMSRQSVDAIFQQLMEQLGSKILRASPAAVRRMLQLRKPDPEAIDRDIASGGLTRAFSVVITHAQEMGDLPKGLSPLETAEILTSVVMGCISKWSIVGNDNLIETLRRRAMFVLAGARGLNP
jgi:AcrR family transcriptional regulator